MWFFMCLLLSFGSSTLMGVDDFSLDIVLASNPSSRLCENVFKKYEVVFKTHEIDFILHNLTKNTKKNVGDKSFLGVPWPIVVTSQQPSANHRDIFDIVFMAFPSR